MVSRIGGALIWKYNFVAGKFIKQGQIFRAKAQLDQLQTEIASVARKTGISSATKLALLAHHRETVDAEIPAVEWWDSDVLNHAKRSVRVRFPCSHTPVHPYMCYMSSPVYQVKTLCICMSDSSQPAELPWYIAQLVKLQPPRKQKVVGWNEMRWYQTLCLALYLYE